MPLQLSGKLITPLGSPASNAQIRFTAISSVSNSAGEVIPGSSQTARCDANGDYTISLEFGGYEVSTKISTQDFIVHGKVYVDQDTTASNLEDLLEAIGIETALTDVLIKEFQAIKSDAENAASRAEYAAAFTPAGYGYDGTKATTDKFIDWLNGTSTMQASGDFELGTTGQDTVIPFKQLSNLKGLVVNKVNLGADFIPGKYLNIPDSFPFNPGIVCRALYPGKVDLVGWDASNYDFTLDSTIEPQVVYYYVDNINGSNGMPPPNESTSNPGTDKSYPLRSVNKAFDNIASSQNQYSCVLIRGGYYYDSDSWGSRSPNKNIVVKQWIDNSDPRDKERVVLAAESQNLSWSLHSGSVYKATRSGVTFVVDQRKRNYRGDYSYYDRLTSISDVELNPGSYYKDDGDGVIYVHTSDGTAPDNSYIHCYVSKANGGCSDGDYTLYVKGIDFLGGTAGWDGNSRPAGTTETVVLHDVSVKYSASNNFQSYGIDLFIVQDCKSAHSLSDAFNIHSNRGSTPGAPDALTQVCKYIEINCESWDSGKSYGLNSDSNNGSTVHENNIAIRLGGLHDTSQGPVVADVQGAQSYNFCVLSMESVRDSDTARKTSFLISGDLGGKMWLDNCMARKSKYSIDAYNGGKMMLEDTSIDSAIEGVENILTIQR